MLSWILSLLLYLGTILAGLYIDSKPAEQYHKVRRIYVVWLYVFLCFGYMTGSDWRNYEYIYETGDGILRFVTEPVSFILFKICPVIIKDFWIFLGLSKCLFLHSTIKLLSTLTDRWMSCVALLITSTLSFLLFDNPFRYVMGLVFVNYALILVYRHMTKEHVDNYYIKTIALLLLAVCCHNTCVVFLLIVPLLPLALKLSKINSIIIFIAYLIVTIIASNIAMLGSVVEDFLLLMRAVDLNEYAAYEIEDNSYIFSIGNILRIVFFVFILATRNTVVKNNKNGYVVYCMAIVYCFLARIFIIIPTGFRLPMPFAVFYIVYVFYMLISKYFYGKLIVAYMLLAFVTNAWTSKSLIPYSNSIPYILTEHKPLAVRYWYNLEEYKARTGKDDESYFLYEGPWR